MGIFIKQDAYWIDYSLANGKRKREKVGPSKKLAQELLSKRRAQVAELRYFPERFMLNRSFDEVLAKVWKLHASKLRSVKSWSYIHKEVVARFGARKMGAISPSDIQAYYNEVKARTCSTTANKHYTYIRLVFNCAKSWGDFHGENPCRKGTVRRERDRNHRWRYLSRDEMERLVRVAHPRLKPLLACALLTGMRRGEMLNLDWRDLDLKRGFICVLQTKSDKSRTVPMPPKLHEMFLAMEPKPEGKVFPLPIISLRKYFARALKAADIKDCRLHDLRHTYASHYLMKTSDLAGLQRNLGHSTPMLTMRYAHLSDAHMKANTELFEDAVPLPAPDTLMTPATTRESDLKRIDVVKSNQLAPARRRRTHAF